jgi:hypothetical protein
VTVHPADIEHGIYLSGENCLNTMSQENVRYVVEKDLSRTLNNPCFNLVRLPPGKRDFPGRTLILV